MPAKKFIIPFAATGDKTAVPNTLQPDGTVSYAQGFGPDYELDKTLDPINAKDVPRDQTNQIYFDLTDAVGEQQLYGVALWGADRAPYPLNARVYHNDKLWRSNVINNSGEPGFSGWDDVSVQTLPPLPLGYFSGFTLVNNTGAPNTTIDVAAGAARSSDNTVDISINSTLRGILQLSGSWAAGDNQNKLDTGAKAINTWYHVFAIRNTSGGTGDILFSLSATAPAMPSGYAGFRRIGAVRTDASGNILGFINELDEFRWKVPTVDLTSAAIATLTNYVMKVPTGVRVVGKFGVQGNGADYGYNFCEPDSGDLPSPMYYGVLTGVGDDRGGQDHFVITNTSAQVRIKTSGPVVQINVSTLGWQELRG